MRHRPTLAGMTNDPASDAIEARRDPVAIVVLSDYI